MTRPTLHGYDHGNENLKISTDPDDDQNICRPAKDISSAEDGLEDPDCIIRKIKLKNMNNPTFAYINVNSIRYKHADLFAVINSNIDVLSIAETKLDSSFPNAQFLVDEYKEAYRKDRNVHVEGLLVYVKQDIPSREPKDHPLLSNSFDIIVIELNFRKAMRLLINVYKPPSVSDSAFCEKISGTIDFYSEKYKNIVLMGDFNMQPTDNNFQTFCESHDLCNLIKDKAWFKTIEGTCIDLILTNQKRSLKNTCTVETGIGDFHRMILTQLKLTFEKFPPKIITSRDYKHFNKDKFERDLVLALVSNPASTYSYNQFLVTFESVLDKHVPVKRRKVRGNQMLFMNKPLRQAIMCRSKLRNLCHKSRKSSDWDNYRKQRNYSVKLRNKARRDYFNNM